jgi:hypothetical protein
MIELDDLRDDTLAVYASLAGALATRLGQTRTRMLADSRGKLAAAQLTVVVCGEFKRGKSSVLNALVERPGLFPVDADIATSAVMTLCWGQKEGATVYFAETTPGQHDSAPPPLQIEVGRAADFVTEKGNPDNGKNVLRIDMTAPLEQLASGMVLVDTPGLSSLNPAHTMATRAFLKFADAILFVVSAVEPPSTGELDFLRLALQQCPTVVTAVTMIDRVVDPAPVVDEARERIARIIGCDPASLVIVPVSAHRKRDALEDDDPALLAESGFLQLEAELWQGLTVTVGVAQVNAALDALYTALAEGAAPVANDLAVLRANQGDSGAAVAELRSRQEELRQLKADAKGWKRKLDDDLDRGVRPVLKRLESDLDKLFDAFRDALGTDEAIQDPNRIIQRACGAMEAAGDEANDALEQVFEDIAARYKAETRLPIVVSGLALDSTELSLVVKAPPRVARPKTRFTTVRQVWAGGVFTGTIGAAVGTMVAPPVGTVIGGLVGFAAGLFGQGRDHRKTAQERERREYVQELRTVVLEKLKPGRAQLTRGVQDQIKDRSIALKRALDDEITAQGDSLAASVRALEETARRDAQSRANQERDLARQQAEFAALRAELDRLRARANALVDRFAKSAGVSA